MVGYIDHIDILKLHVFKYIHIYRLKVVAFLDLTLFLNPIYTNICIGMTLAIFADMSFVTIQSSYLRSIMFTKDETAQIVSIGVAADVSSRLILTVVSSPLQIRARPLFLAGVIATIASLLGELLHFIERKNPSLEPIHYIR